MPYVPNLGKVVPFRNVTCCMCDAIAEHKKARSSATLISASRAWFSWRKLVRNGSAAIKRLFDTATGQMV
jgi:hypothetical protein